MFKLFNSIFVLTFNLSYIFEVDFSCFKHQHRVFYLNFQTSRIQNINIQIKLFSFFVKRINIDTRYKNNCDTSLQLSV